MYIVNKATYAFVIGTVFITLNVVAINIKRKWWQNDEYQWTRAMSYWMLLFAYDGFFGMDDKRMRIYFSLLFVTMIADAFDFPDKFAGSRRNDVPMSEGLCILTRAVGSYMLITSWLIEVQGAHYTQFEYAVLSTFGALK